MADSEGSLQERHSRFELRTIMETSRMLIESHDMEFVMNNLLLITMGKLLITRGAILLYEPAKDSYLVKRTKGRTTLSEDETLSFDDGEKLKDQSWFKTDDVTDHLPEELREEPNCTFFNLRTSNHHIGFLVLGPKGSRQPLTDWEHEFIESLVIISAVAIANTRLFAELRNINRKLDRKVYELNTLFDLSKDFNMMVDRDEISQVFKFAMLGQLLIRKFFFLLEKNNEKELVANSGIRDTFSQDEIEKLFALEEDVLRVDDDLASEIPILKRNEIKALVGLRFQNEKLGLVGVGPRANKEEYSDSDLNFLSSLGNLALLSIQKSLLLEERIEKERIEEELNIATTIQQGLLPSPLPDIYNLDLAGTNISSHQVGGDYYDIIETPEHNYLFAIADVTGKGVPASLLMANLQAMLHALSPVDITLSDATGRINDIIYKNTPADKFITFFWAKYIPSERSFAFVNAGHNPPLLLRKGKTEMELLDEGGLLLGAMSTMMPYQQEIVTLQPDDLVVLFTDGVTEAMNENEEEYGDDRLQQVILENRDQNSEQIMQAVINDLKEHTSEMETQFDDITMLVIKGKDGN